MSERNRYIPEYMRELVDLVLQAIDAFWKACIRHNRPVRILSRAHLRFRESEPC